MTTKYFVDAAGVYLGGYDGAPAPAGAIEVPAPPPHGLMRRVAGNWIDTPASLFAKRPSIDFEKLVDALKAKAGLTDQDVGR
jgi:hypothetical protein